MPVDRPLFIDAAGRLVLSATGQLGCCCQSFGFFEFDESVEDESLYDVVVDNPFAFTLRSVHFYNVGEAIDGAIVFWGGQGEGGTPVEFTSGEAGTPYPATSINIPVSGEWDYFCNQPVPALGYLQFNTGDFADPGTVTAGVLAEFRYSRP